MLPDGAPRSRSLAPGASHRVRFEPFDVATAHHDARIHTKRRVGVPKMELLQLRVAARELRPELDARRRGTVSSPPW